MRAKPGQARLMHNTPFYIGKTRRTKKILKKEKYRLIKWANNLEVLHTEELRQENHACLKCCTTPQHAQSVHFFIPSTPLPSISAPVVASRSTGSIPYMGRQQLPGLVGVTAGKGVSKCPPVSVCQKVSTTLHTLRPITSKYLKKSQRRGRRR